MGNEFWLVLLDLAVTSVRHDPEVITEVFNREFQMPQKGSSTATRKTPAKYGAAKPVAATKIEAKKVLAKRAQR